MSLTVTVIVPGRNCEKTLGRCLSSLRNIKYPYLKVIYVDNCSTDNSLDIAQHFVIEDNRFSIQVATIAGVSIARNVGLSLLQENQYVAFVDSDDRVTENFLSEKVLAALNRDTDLVFCDWKEVNNSTDGYRRNIGKLSSISQEGLIEHFLRDRSGGAPWAKYYRTNIINQNQIQFNVDLYYGEDYVFNLEYLKHVETVEYVRNIVYEYTIGQNSDKYSRQYLETFLKIDSEISRLFPDPDKASAKLINESRMEQLITPVAQDINQRKFQDIQVDLGHSKSLLKKFGIDLCEVLQSNIKCKLKLAIIAAYFTKDV